MATERIAQRVSDRTACSLVVTSRRCRVHEAMVEGASEGLVVLNSDGLILRANRSAPR